MNHDPHLSYASTAKTYAADRVRVGDPAYTVTTTDGVGAVVPERIVTPVAEHLERLGAVQDTTHDLIEALTAKLHPVLRDPSPTKDGGGPEPMPESPLCHELRSRTDTARYMNERLRGLLDRLTV